MLTSQLDELGALSGLWAALLSGSWRVVKHSHADDRISVTLRRQPVERPFSDRDADLLRQFLLARGKPRVARKHAARICAAAIRATGFRCVPSRVPLVLILAAHASAVAPPQPFDGDEVVLEFAIGRPHFRGLSDAENAVARGILRGESYKQISAERGTSYRTVANQISAVFAIVGVYSAGELRASFARWRTRSAQRSEAA
jgi:DNA-binding NarL/FixJ family response regulator